MKHIFSILKNELLMKFKLNRPIAEIEILKTATNAMSDEPTKL